MLTRIIYRDAVEKKTSVAYIEPTDVNLMFFVKSHDLAKVPLAPGLMMVVDEHGLYRQGQSFWTFGNFPYPIPGSAVFIGCDEKGNAKDCPFSSAATVDSNIDIVPLQAIEIAMPKEGPGLGTLAQPTVNVPDPRIRG